MSDQSRHLDPGAEAAETAEPAEAGPPETVPSPRRPGARWRWVRRWARRTRRALLAFALLVVLIVIGLAQTGGGQEIVLDATLDRVRSSLAGELAIEGIRSGTLLTGATLRGVRLDASDGRRFMTADSVVVRYSILSFLATGSPLRSTTLWGLDLEISRDAGHDAINVARLLAPRASGSGEAQPARTLFLGRIGVRDGTVQILTPAQPESTAPTIRGPTGETLRRLAFENLDLDLEEALLRPGGAVEFEAGLASLSSSILLRRQPLVIHEAFGHITYGAQGIRVLDADIRLPGTLLAGDVTVGPRRPGEPWVFQSSLALDDWGDLADLNWIDTRIPRGRLRGQAEIDIENAIAVDLNDLEVELEASAVVVDGRVRFGDVISMQALEITASPLLLSRLEPWFESQFPLEGWLSGQATFDGTFADLTTAGRMTLVPTGYGGAPTTADFSGAVVRGADLGFRDLAVRLDRINYRILDAFLPGAPGAGGGFGQFEIDGSADDGMALTADFSSLADSLSSSATRVTASGMVRRLEDGEWALDLRSDLTPLSLGAISFVAPDLGLRGELSGPLRVEGRLADLRVTGDLTGVGGELSFDASFDARAPGSGYRLRGEGNAVSLAGLSSRMPEGSYWSGAFAVEGSGLVLDSMMTTAEITVRDGRIGDLHVDTARARLRLLAGVLITDSLEATVGGIEVDGRGRFGLAPGTWGSSRFEFESETLVGLRPMLMGRGDSIMVSEDLTSELERELTRALGIDPDTLPSARDVRMEGALRGAANVSGEIRDFDLGLLVDVVGGAYQNNEIDTARLALTATGLPGARGSWAVGASAQGIAWQDREFEHGGFEAEMLDMGGRGRIEVVRRPGEEYRAEGSFAVDSAGGEVRLTDARIQIDAQRWELTRPGRVAWNETTLTVDSVEITRTDGDPMYLAVDGTLTRGGESDFRLQLEGLHLEQLVYVGQVGGLDLRGHIDLDVSVQGPAEAPVVRGLFGVEGARYGALELTRVEGSVDYEDRLAAFRVDGWDDARDVLNARGTIPVDLSLTPVEDRVLQEAMDIQISADSIDAAIALSYITALEDVVGIVSANVRIRGTPDDPEPEGVVVLANAGWSIEALGVRHTGVDGSLDLHPDGTVDVALAATGPGSSNVSGTVLLDPVSDPLLDLSFRFNRFQAVRRPDIEGLISGEFVLGGTYRRPRADGALTVVQGTVYVEEIQRAAGVVDLRDPILLLDQTFGVDTTALVTQPLIAGLRNPFFDNLRVDIDLSVPRDTWLRSTETNVEMGGSLLVRYDRQVGDLVLVGELQALRGSHLVLGRTFELDGGTVGFMGRPGFNPTLNIQASTRIRRPQESPLDVTALVEGTLIQPIVTLSTDEAGLAQSDLVSYLVFGQPSGALGGSQAELANSAASTVASAGLTYFGGAALNQVYGAIGRTVGLDYLSVQRTEFGTGGGIDALGLTDAQWEAGRYVGDDVFVVLVFRPTADQTQNASFLAGARVEWALTDAANFEVFLEDRFLRTGTVGFGAPGLMDDSRIVGFFFFREWGY